MIDHDLTLWARYSKADGDMQRWQGEWAALERYLQDDHAADTLEAARRAFKMSSVAWNQEQSWVYLPLVRMLAKRMSVTFDVAPSTYLVRRGSEDPLPETDPSVVQWRIDEQRLNLPAWGQDIELRVTALATAVSVPTWVGDGIEWLTYSPSDVRVLPGSQRPGDLQAARVVGFRLRLGPGADGSPQADQWLCYTLDEHGQRGLWQVSEEGMRTRAPLFEGGANPYACLPAVAWSWEMPRRGSWWCPPPSSLLASQRAVNLDMTDLHHGMRFNAHPVRVRYGQQIAPPGGKLSEVAVGPGFEANFQDRASGGMEFVSPNLNSEEHRATIESLLQKLAVMNGLPPDAFATYSPVRNLGAMQEVKAELQRIRVQRRPIVQRLLAQQFAAHRAVGNAWAEIASWLAGQGISVPSRSRIADDVEIRLEVVERAGVEDRQSAAQSTAIEIQTGQTSPVELEMGRAGTTRAEAAAAVARREADNANVNGVA